MPSFDVDGVGCGRDALLKLAPPDPVPRREVQGEEVAPEVEHLGVVGVDAPQQTMDFQVFLRRLIREDHPRLALVECWLGDAPKPTSGSLVVKPIIDWIRAFNFNVQAFLEAGYEPLKSEAYDCRIEPTRWRFYVVLKAK